MSNELRPGPPMLTTIKGFNDSVLIPTTPPMVANTSLAPSPPRSTLEMISGGHAVWIDDPQQVAASMRRFLKPAASSAM